MAKPGLQLIRRSIPPTKVLVPDCSQLLLCCFTHCRLPLSAHCKTRIVLSLYCYCTTSYYHIVLWWYFWVPCRLYCIGTLHRQLQLLALSDPAVQERSRMAAQFGLRALLKRSLVLHASKLVALCCFAAAMQVRCAVLRCAQCMRVASVLASWGAASWPAASNRMETVHHKVDGWA